MIRVLHYVGSMRRGGMETLIMNLYRNVNREEIQFDFAVHGDFAGDFAPEINSLGGRFFFFPRMRKNPVAYRKSWRVFWESHCHEYRAFHFHTNSLANIIAFEEAYRVGVPIRIVHSHSSFSDKGRLQWLNTILNIINRYKVKKYATILIACSDKAAQWLYGGMQMGNLQVHLLKNGVDLRQFKYSDRARVRIRAELNLGDEILIGHVGAFVPVKNHYFLIKVISEALKINPKVRAILVGEGVLINNMKVLVKDLGLTDVVYFMGIRDDVNALMSAMDVFVFPSLYEGLPVSMIEVQANGLPALMSDTITDDVVLNPNVKRLTINSSAKVWAQSLLDMAKPSYRVLDDTSLISNGFDIVDSTMRYTEILLSE